MTCAEYLAAEATSEVRHEFLNGEVWAMDRTMPCLLPPGVPLGTP